MRTDTTIHIRQEDTFSLSVEKSKEGAYAVLNIHSPKPGDQGTTIFPDIKGLESLVRIGAEAMGVLANHRSELEKFELEKFEADEVLF